MVQRSPILGPAYVAAIFATIVAVFWPTFYALMDLAGTYAENYTHRTLVIPVFAVLLWGQRFELAALPIRGVRWSLIGLIGAGLMWLIGEIVFARVLTDLAVIAMVPIAVQVILGTRWLEALAFPLAFLLFAVPAEGPLVPVLVNWTAKAAFAGIQASGVPIYREGAYFMIPSGGWAIADACSGIHYLIVCLMLGALYAWTMYQSALKRAIFFGGAIIIGVVGNWIRAYLTIMIAHVTDNRLLRNGHGTFGWVLFAVFMFGYAWIGWRFREIQNTDVRSSDNASAGQYAGSGARSGRQAVILAALAFVCIAAWPLLDLVLAWSQQEQTVPLINVVPQRGWSRVEKRSVEWTPQLKNPTLESVQSFEKNGTRVDVFMGIFQRQTWDSKLVTSVNQFVDSERPNWSLAERGMARVAFGGIPLEVNTGVIVGRVHRIVAWQWYWTNGIFTGSDTMAKIQQLLARLRGRSGSSAWIAVYTESPESPELASRALEKFVREMGDSLERSLVASAGH